ncbi:uncharacterized protein [Panulirus ornatus]|uniref:uncharacterized protein n=1 Tax=Panulirus ornatus TaxID=150431 RepID=UPI003A8C6822
MRIAGSQARMPQPLHLDRLPWHNNHNHHRLLSLSFILLLQLHKPATCDHRARGRPGSLSQPQHLRLQPWTPQELVASVMAGVAEEPPHHRSSDPVFTEVPAYAKLETPKPLKHRTSRGVDYRFRRPAVLLARRYKHLRTSRSGRDSTEDPVHYRVVGSARALVGRGSSRGRSVFGASVQNSSAEYPVSYQGTWKIPPSGRGNMTNLPGLVGNPGATINRDGVDLEMPAGAWKYPGDLPGIDYGTLERLEEQQQQQPPGGVRSVTGKRLTSLDKVTAPPPLSWAGAEDRRHFSYKRRKKMRRKLRQSDLFTSDQNGFVSDYTKRKKKVKEKPRNETVREEVSVAETTQEDMGEPRRRAAVIDFMRDFNENGRPDDEVRRVGNIDARESRRSRSRWGIAGLSPPPPRGERDDRTMSDGRLHPLVNHLHIAPKAGRRFRGVAEHARARRGFGTRRTRVGRSSRPIQVFCKTDEGRSSRRGTGRSRPLQVPPPAGTDEGVDQQQESEGNASIIAVAIHKRPRSAHALHKGRQRRRNSSDTSPIEAKVEEGLEAGSETPHRPTKRPPRPWNNPRRPPPSSQTQRPSLRSPPGREDVQRESQSQARGRTRERGRARGEAAEKENVGQIIIRTGEDRGKSRREAKQKTIDVIQRPTKVVDERAVARWTRRNMRTAIRNVAQGGRTHHRQSGNRNRSVTKRDAVTEERWKRELKQIYREGKSATEDMIHDASNRSGKTRVDETPKREIDQERRDEARIMTERSISSWGGEASGGAGAAAASGHLNEQDGRTPTEIWDNLISRRGRFPTDATDKKRRDSPASTTHALHPSFAVLTVYHGSASRVHGSPDTKVLTRSSTDPVDQVQSSSTERESNPTPRRRPSLPLTPLRKRNDNEIFTEVFREKTWGVRAVDGEERPSTQESVLGQSPLLGAVQPVIDVGRCCKGHYDKVDEWCVASAAYLPPSRNGVQVTPQILILESPDGGLCWVLSSSSSSSQDGDLGGGVHGAGGPSWCCRDSRHNEGDYGHSRPYGDRHRSENGTAPRCRSGGWTLWGCGFIIQRTSLLPGRLSRRHATLIIIRPRDLTTLCTPVTALGGAFQQAIRTTLGRLLLLVMFLDTTVPGGSTSGSLLLGGQRTQGGPSPRMGAAQGQVDPHVAGALSGKLFTSPPAEGRRDLWKYTTSNVDLSHHKTKGQEEPREANEERKVSVMAPLSDNPKTHTEEVLRLAEGEAAEHRATLARYPLDQEGPTGAGTIVLGDAGGKIPTRTRPTASVNKESLPDRGEALEIVRQTFYDLQRSSDIGSNSALGMLTGRVGSGRKLDPSAGNQRSKRNVASRRWNTKRITRTWKGGDDNVRVGGDMKNIRKHQRTDDNGGGTPGTKDATSSGGGRYWMVRDANREGHRWRRRRGAKRLISSNSENYGAVGSPEATVNNRSTNAFTASVRHSHRGKNSSKSGDTTARGLQVNSLGSTSHSVQGHTSTPRVSKLPESFVESGSGHNITSAANTNPERRTPGSAPAGGAAAAAGGSGGVRCPQCSAQQHLPEIFTSKKSFISYSTRPLAGESSSTSPDRPAYFPEDLPQTLEGPHLPGFKDPGERLAFDRSKFPVYDSLPGKVSEESEENRRNFRRNEGIILINENQNSSLTLASAKSIPGLNNSSTRNTSSSDGLMSNASVMNDLQKSDENGSKTTVTEATSRKTENSTEIIESNTGVDSSGGSFSESPTSPGVPLLTEGVYGILQTQGASRTSPTENPVLQVTRKWSSEVWDASVRREKDHRALGKQNNAEDSKISSPRVDGAQELFDVASSIVQYGREAGEQPSGNMGFRRKTTGNVSGSPGNEKDLESGKTGGVFTPSRWQKPGPLEWRTLPVWSPLDYRTYHVGFTGRQSSSSVDRHHSVTSPGPPRLASSLEHRVPDSFPTSGLPHTHGEIPAVRERDRENVRSFFSKTHNYQRNIAGQPRTVELSERHYQFHRPSSDLRVGSALGKAQGHVQGRLQIPPQRQPRLRLARQRQTHYQSRKGNYSQENDTGSEKRPFQNPDHLGHPRDRPLSHPQNPGSPSGNSHNPISNDASRTTHDPHGRRSSYLQTPPLQFSRGHSSKHQPVPRLNYTTHHLQQHQEPHHAKRSRNSHNASPSRRDQQQWTRHSSPRGGQPPTPERQVPLLGLFDLTMRGERRLGGRSELAAAQLALAHINNQGVIPGHRLVMFHNDTKCDSGSGVDAFFHAIYTSQAKMMILLGAACPEVTESLAAVVHYWNVVQVSFGSVSPALSDRSSFPRFIRTVAPDSSHNAARLSFLTHHSWTTVATISENHDMYTLALNELMPALEAANISLQATVTLSQGDYTEHLHTLKERNCRIFIASFSADLARKVFCQVSQ